LLDSLLQERTEEYLGELPSVLRFQTRDIEV